MRRRFAALVFWNTKETRLQPLCMCARACCMWRVTSLCRRVLSGVGVTGTGLQVVGVLFGRPTDRLITLWPHSSHDDRSTTRQVRPLVLSRRLLETQSSHVRRNERRNEIVISPLPHPARKTRPPAVADVWELAAFPARTNLNDPHCETDDNYVIKTDVDKST